MNKKQIRVVFILFLFLATLFILFRVVFRLYLLSTPLYGLPYFDQPKYQKFSDREKIGEEVFDPETAKIIQTWTSLLGDDLNQSLHGAIALHNSNDKAVRVEVLYSTYHLNKEILKPKTIHVEILPGETVFHSELISRMENILPGTNLFNIVDELSEEHTDQNGKLNYKTYTPAREKETERIINLYTDYARNTKIAATIKNTTSLSTEYEEYLMKHKYHIRRTEISADKFTITNITQTDKIDNEGSIFGSITNNGDKRVGGVWARMILYDRNGNIISNTTQLVWTCVSNPRYGETYRVLTELNSDSRAYLCEPTRIEPGETASFRIFTPHHFYYIVEKDFTLDVQIEKAVYKSKISDDLFRLQSFLKFIFL